MSPLIRTTLLTALLVMPLSVQAAGSVEQGRFTFKTYCMFCHQDPEHPDESQYRIRNGLDIRGIVDGESTIGLGFLDEARLTEFLKNPKAMKADTQMMRMPMNDQQIADVIAYMRTLPAPFEKEAPAAAATTAAGKATVAPPKIVRRCITCHDFSPQKRAGTGPALFGIYGRAPTIAGVPFKVWDDAALDKWLTSPKAVKPNTKMIFSGIEQFPVRKEMIDYLKSLK